MRREQVQSLDTALCRIDEIESRVAVMESQLAEYMMAKQTTPDVPEVAKPQTSKCPRKRSKE